MSSEFWKFAYKHKSDL